MMVHLAAWSGLRAAELGGLQLGDVDLPPGRGKPGTLRVERTSIVVDGKTAYDSPETRGSRRRVPLTQDSVTVLRAYLEVHPLQDDPLARFSPPSASLARSRRVCGLKTEMASASLPPLTRRSPRYRPAMRSVGCV